MMDRFVELSLVSACPSSLSLVLSKNSYVSLSSLLFAVAPLLSSSPLTVFFQFELADSDAEFFSRKDVSLEMVPMEREITKVEYSPLELLCISNFKIDTSWTIVARRNSLLTNLLSLLDSELKYGLSFLFFLANMVTLSLWTGWNGGLKFANTGRPYTFAILICSEIHEILTHRGIIFFHWVHLVLHPLCSCIWL